jgi:endogenous inhibitor of DNA gyrase (YacG/DUF329 family)
VYTDNPFRPFCSARCKGADLGNWATESYRIQGESLESEEDSLAKPMKQSEED